MTSHAAKEKRFLKRNPAKRGQPQIPGWTPEARAARRRRRSGDPPPGRAARGEAGAGESAVNTHAVATPSLGGDRVREDSGQIIGRAPGERLRQPEADDDGGGLVQRVACFTASAMLLAADSMASRGSPSTITRSTGSVPDGRSRTRPLPSSKRSTSDCAFLIASCFSHSKRARPRSGAPGEHHELRGELGEERRDSRIALSTCRAETMPSPVVCLSRQMRCPEFSPPSCQPLSA